MIKLNYTQHRKLPNTDRAEQDIYLHLVADLEVLDKEMSSHTAEAIENLWSKSSAAKNITSLINNIEALSQNFDSTMLANLFESIVKLDPQVYYDIMQMAYAALMVKYYQSRTDFTDSIMSIVDFEQAYRESAALEAETMKEEEITDTSIATESAEDATTEDEKVEVLD